MKKCPYCRHENKDDAENCEKCFASLPSEKKAQSSKKAEKKSNKE